LVGGTGVLVGGTGVFVGGTGVLVGGTDVFVGGIGVLVGGTGVFVGGTDVLVGGTGVDVGGGTGVLVTRGGVIVPPCAFTTVGWMKNDAKIIKTHTAIPSTRTVRIASPPLLK
jgi:hypothetical protein